MRRLGTSSSRVIASLLEVALLVGSGVACELWLQRGLNYLFAAFACCLFGAAVAKVTIIKLDSADFGFPDLRPKQRAAELLISIPVGGMPATILVFAYDIPLLLMAAGFSWHYHFHLRYAMAYWQGGRLVVCYIRPRGAGSMDFLTSGLSAVRRRRLHLSLPGLLAGDLHKVPKRSELGHR